MSSDSDVSAEIFVVPGTSEKKPKPRKRNKSKAAKKKEEVPVEETTPESCKSKLFHAPHQTNMIALLKKDRTAEDSYCDVTVIVDGQQFPAHKCVLGKLSAFFHKMFKVEMQERYSTEAKVYGVALSVFKTILNYMYTGTIKLTEDNVMDILVACDYLQMDGLKKFCVEFLGSSLNLSNCLELQRSGQLFNCPSLSDAAATLTARNFREIIEQQQFKELDKQSLIQFISSRDQMAFGSKDVYEGVLSWVNYDLENRKDNFVELFKLVKLHLMNPDYLEEVVHQQKLVQQSHECKDYFQKELLYCLKMSKFIPSQTSQTATNDGKSQPVASTTEGPGNATTNELKSSQGPQLQKTPAKVVPPKPKNDKKNKAKGNISKNSSASDIQYIRQNSNTSQDSPRPSGARVNSSSDSGSDKNYSVELVRILRHGKYPDIPLDDVGFADVNAILTNKKLQQKFGQKSMKDLRKIVHSGDKKRFELKQFGSVWKIKAVDKHSVKLRKGSSDDVAANQRRSSNISLSSNSPSPTSYPGNAEVSKELVRILRHGSYRDISIDSSGYASAEKILNHPRFRKLCGTLSVDDLEYIVETSERQYFEMIRVGTEWKIKANHGHSVEVNNLQLRPLTEEACWSRFIHHRTTHEAWANIQKHGLSRMKRTHIHFFIGIPNASDVDGGKAPNTEIAIVVDFVRASEAGLQFFLSTNDTVISPGDFDGVISTEFFSHVIQLFPHWERLM